MRSNLWSLCYFQNRINPTQLLTVSEAQVTLQVLNELVAVKFITPVHFRLFGTATEDPSNKLDILKTVDCK